MNDGEAAGLLGFGAQRLERRRRFRGPGGEAGGVQGQLPALGGFQQPRLPLGGGDGWMGGIHLTRPFQQRPGLLELLPIQGIQG